jgi:3-hydroxyacyl-[acyl-carrier-protein] dehydratase
VANSATRSLEHSVNNLLPHRYPFLLIDRITEFIPGQHIAASKHFSANDESLQGYSPHALIPAGILFELVTQLGAVLVMERPEMEGKVPVILQIPSAHMFQPVQAGESLHLEAQVLKIRENFGELRGAIYREGQLVGEGQMRFAIADRSSLKLNVDNQNSRGHASLSET